MLCFDAFDQEQQEARRLEDVVDRVFLLIILGSFFLVGTVTAHAG